MSSSRREARRASGPNGYTTSAAGRRCRAAATSRRPRRPTCSRATSANSSQVGSATGDPRTLRLVLPPNPYQVETMHGPTRPGSIARRHPHDHLAGRAVAPSCDFAWLEALDRELLSFDAALTATPRRSSSIAASTSAHTGKKLVAGDHGARQRGQEHRVLVVAGKD